MKKINIVFWIFTGVLSAFMIMSAIPEIGQTAESKTFMQQLGYPDYFNPFIGVMKILGVIAILVPGFNRLKEWAYAGLFFDLSGATYSLIAAGGFKPQVGFMLFPIGVLLVSYVYFHKKIKKRAPVI